MRRFVAIASAVSLAAGQVHAAEYTDTNPLQKRASLRVDMTQLAIAPAGPEQEVYRYTLDVVAKGREFIDGKLVTHLRTVMEGNCQTMETREIHGMFMNGDQKVADNAIHHPDWYRAEEGAPVRQALSGICEKIRMFCATTGANSPFEDCRAYVVRSYVNPPKPQ
jgi:hypothetical protein